VPQQTNQSCNVKYALPAHPIHQVAAQYVRQCSSNGRAYNIIKLWYLRHMRCKFLRLKSFETRRFWRAKNVRFYQNVYDTVRHAIYVICKFRYWACLKHLKRKKTLASRIRLRK
jgi:hypothetical protein